MVGQIERFGLTNHIYNSTFLTKLLVIEVLHKKIQLLCRNQCQYVEHIYFLIYLVGFFCQIINIWFFLIVMAMF
jgi:hypothetical protein